MSSLVSFSHHYRHTTVVRDGSLPSSPCSSSPFSSLAQEAFGSTPTRLFNPSYPLPQRGNSPEGCLGGGLPSLSRSSFDTAVREATADVIGASTHGFLNGRGYSPPPSSVRFPQLYSYSQASRILHCSTLRCAGDAPSPMFVSLLEQLCARALSRHRPVSEAPSGATNHGQCDDGRFFFEDILYLHTSVMRAVLVGAPESCSGGVGIFFSPEITGLCCANQRFIDEEANGSDGALTVTPSCSLPNSLRSDISLGPTTSSAPQSSERVRLVDAPSCSLSMLSEGRGVSPSPPRPDAHTPTIATVGVRRRESPIGNTARSAPRVGCAGRGEVSPSPARVRGGSLGGVSAHLHRASPSRIATASRTCASDFVPHRLVCSQYSSSGVCSFGARCRYYHPSPAQSSARGTSSAASNPRCLLVGAALREPVVPQGRGTSCFGVSMHAAPFTRLLLGGRSEGDGDAPSERFETAMTMGTDESVCEAASIEYIADVPVRTHHCASIA